jgi:hypothetical protein
MFATKNSGRARPRTGRRLTRLLKGLVGAVALALFAGALTPPAEAGPPSSVRGRQVRVNGPRAPRPPDWVQSHVNPGVWSSLNPQPLPPRVQQSVGRVNPGVWSSLNPQPLPPRVYNSNSRVNPGVWSSLNPQPLPPRVATSGRGVLVGR